MRPLALGRKNYLFAGSDEGGRRAAIIYTLIETARLNDVDPEAWLGDVISRIADHPNTKIDELLPWKWTTPGSQAIAAELAPNARPGRLGNSGFIRGSAGRGCRAADEARSAFCRRGSYADESRYTTPHQNTHLSMPLKERGFAGRGLILWGIGPCDARVQRGL